MSQCPAPEYYPVRDDAEQRVAEYRNWLDTVLDEYARRNEQMEDRDGE